MSREPSPTTRSVRAGVGDDPAHGAVMPPVYLSATYTFAGFDRKRRYDYTRTGNPTRDQLVHALAELEGAAGGVVTSSGMSAVALVTHLLEPGDLLVAPDDLYGGTHRLFTALARKGRFDLRLVPMHRGPVAESLAALAPRLIWVETPSNPLLRITDLQRVRRAADEAGALVAVDNTLLSPALQRPVEHGADIVVHSTTKFINGHSDVVGGAALAADDGVVEELAWWANCLGITGAPFDAYLTLRGLRTLDARVRAHGDNAARVVEALASHPGVARVRYPGLEGHPDHALACRQQAGFGSMVSLELDAAVNIEAFLNALRCFSLAESLGGVESLVAHPATMTHAAMPPEARAEAGIGDRLVRLSVGIEDADDLVADLRAALDAAGRRGHAGPARDDVVDPEAAKCSG
ncbi:MAG: cystathionine gamma-synthase [Acidobacteriota bacterium]